MIIRYLLAVLLIMVASPPQADSVTDYNETLKIFDRAHERRMQTDPAYRHQTLGDEFADDRQYRQAIEEYRQAVPHAPKDAFLHAKLGRALVATGHPREGLGMLNKSIVMSSGKEHWLYWAHLYKGTAHGMLGQMDSAILALTRSIKMKATVLGHVTRASIYGQNGDLAAALRDYEAAVELKPDDKMLWAFKAQVHLMASAKAPNAGHKAKACRAMRRACDLGECRPLNEFTECKIN